MECNQIGCLRKTTRTTGHMAFCDKHYHVYRTIQNNANEFIANNPLEAEKIFEKAFNDEMEKSKKRIMKIQ